MFLHNIADLNSDDEDFIELLNIELRIPRVFHERINHFEKWNDNEFKQRFRLSKPLVKFVIDKIAGEISSKTKRNNALSPEEMVLIALRFLACESLLTILGELSGVDKSTTSRLITKTIRAIAGLHSEFIEMPSNAEDVQRLRESFYNIRKFPRCIGALDCTHLRIQSPGGQDAALDCTHLRIQSPGGQDAERYRNRKGFFSQNVQVVCDSDLLIRNIVCRWHGSARDSTIFNNSSLKVKLENEEFGEGSLVVGDSGYAVRKYLIAPLANPRTPAEHLFNESQIRTRNPWQILERLLNIFSMSHRYEQETLWRDALEHGNADFLLLL
ncbi:DDE superfamily endonuclease [Popillia japonica]|uniref:DDE superfamily endonuclease n=1 Tax=Popillia japonica TaxID=7064 RepID=A0AAW1MCX4_POPJA